MKNTLQHLKTPQIQETVYLQGQVAEIVDRKNRRFMKVMFTPFSLTIENHGDFHLGDHVEVETSITVQKVKSEFEVA